MIKRAVARSAIACDASAASALYCDLAGLHDWAPEGRPDLAVTRATAAVAGSQRQRSVPGTTSASAPTCPARLRKAAGARARSRSHRYVSRPRAKPAQRCGRRRDRAVRAPRSVGRELARRAERALEILEKVVTVKAVSHCAGPLSRPRGAVRNCFRPAVRPLNATGSPRFLPLSARFEPVSKSRT
jgi:hypothetical protein